MNPTNLAATRTRVFRGALWLPILLTTTLLAGCGGGGGYGGSTTGQTLAPTITAQPANVTVAAGQPASFSVTTAGFTPMSFQWQRSDNGGMSFVDIMGATLSTYTLASATPGDNGATFLVKVSNLYGSATSSRATLTVN